MALKRGWNILVCLLVAWGVILLPRTVLALFDPMSLITGNVQADVFIVLWALSEALGWIPVKPNGIIQFIIYGIKFLITKLVPYFKNTSNVTITDEALSTIVKTVVAEIEKKNTNQEGK